MARLTLLVVVVAAATAGAKKSDRKAREARGSTSDRRGQERRALDKLASRLRERPRKEPRAAQPHRVLEEEGRHSRKESAICYAKRYPDLARRFCGLPGPGAGHPPPPVDPAFHYETCNHGGLEHHFRLNGKIERRVWGCKRERSERERPVERRRGHFTHRESVTCYARRYPDLWRGYCRGREACDFRALYEHYRQAGRKEGRNFGCRFHRGDVVAVTGAGHEGATFLMRVFTFLGLPTGIESQSWADGGAFASADLEFDAPWAADPAAAFRLARNDRGATIAKAPGLAAEASARAWADADTGSTVDAAIVAVGDDRRPAAARLRTWAFVVTAKSTPPWRRMTRVAVQSALARTSLRPVCVFYRGAAEPAEADELVQELRGHGAEVLEHEPRWVPRLREAVAKLPPELKETSTNYLSAEALIGTFLRFDLPLLLDEAKYGRIILYTDTDVLFFREPELWRDFRIRPGDEPPTIVGGTELGETRVKKADGSWYGNALNAGILLMNMRGLRESHDDLVDFVFSDANVANGLSFGDYGPLDQGALNKFYESSLRVVDRATFNHKPYWLWSDDVSILHYHGPKPDEYRAFLREGKPAPGPLQGILDMCDVRPGGAGACGRWLDAYDGFAAGRAASQTEAPDAHERDLGRLVAQLAALDMPTTYVSSSRVALDAHYAYNRLAWLLRPYNISRSAYVAAHAKVSAGAR